MGSQSQGKERVASVCGTWRVVGVEKILACMMECQDWDTQEKAGYS